MPRSVSIRRSLLNNLLVLLLLLGAAVAATSAWGTRALLLRLSHALIVRSLDRTEAELDRFFEPISRVLEMLRLWGESGRLDLDDPAALDALLAPIAGQIPQISALLVADGDGREHMILRRGDEWRSRRIWPERWGGEARWRDWSDAEPTPVDSREDLGYDPRLRPWFRGALEAGGRATWTAPYTFFATQEPGVTASLGFDVGGHVRVVGVDVLLQEISAFTSSFPVSPRGMTFVMDADGRLIGVPGAPLLADAERRKAAILLHPSELGLPLVTDTIAAARRHPLDWPHPVRFRSEGEAWWVEWHHFPLGDRSLLIWVLVPESDLLGDVRKLAAGMLGITLLVALLALLRAVRLARSYSQPIEVLVHESDRIRRGDLEPGAPVESGVHEMDQLAHAHEEMRVALRSLLKLEGDLQVARQIQQDTFPARMPEMPGYEIDAWSEPAEQTGGDTYDVVGVRLDETRSLFVSADHADRVTLLLADATGHGVGPALSVSQVRAMLRMAIRLKSDLAELARHMNDQLCADLRQGRFVTAWIGELDASENVLASLSAGQAPILLYRAEERRFEELPADTTPLGILPDLDVRTSRRIAMAPGDLVAVLSDGIFDASDPSGAEFGTDRVIRTLTDHRDESASQILRALRDALAAFTRGHPAHDDRTAIVVKRRA